MPNGLKQIFMSKRTYGLAGAIAIAIWLLAWTVNFFNLVNILNIGGQTVTTGALSLNIGTRAVSMGTANALGVKAMALLTAIPGGLLTQASLSGLLVLFIGTAVLVILGRWIHSLVPNAFKGKGRFKLAIELLYGAIVGTVLIAGFGGVGITAIITMAIYYGIITLVLMPILTRLNWYAKLVRE